MEPHKKRIRIEVREELEEMAGILKDKLNEQHYENSAHVQEEVNNIFAQMSERITALENDAKTEEEGNSVAEVNEMRAALNSLMMLFNVSGDGMS